jgi:two-component system chemotaxis response regulator CheY
MPCFSNDVVNGKREAAMNKKILIVDDSRTVRHQVTTALVPAGFEVIEAEDGREGLATIKSRSDLALILCDVNMPNMNGLEMLRAVKDGGIVAPPIVMLTTEGRTDLIEEGKRTGAKGWVVKPFKPDQLVAIARKLAGAKQP